MIIQHKDFKISYFSTEQKEEIEAFLSILKDASMNIRCRTSGSTGTPKEIELQKTALAVSAQNSIDFFQLKPKQSAILCMSVEFIAGKMMLVRSMIAGLHLKILPVTSNLSECIEPSQFIALFPKQLQGLVGSNRGLDALKKTKNILIGGAMLSPELEGILNVNQLTIYQSYGMTETATHVALKKSGYRGEDYYKAINGVSFDKIKGCLVISYPKIQEKPITTNDLVELIDPLTFKWIGRVDFVINTGGFKVSPEQLETKLARLLNCACMVTGITDLEFGEKIGLILKRSIPKEAVYKKFFKKKLHPFEIPKSYVCIDEFSQTSNGKLDRVKTASKIKDSAWENIL